MELESLRYIWHSLEPPAGPKRDRRGVMELLEKRSRGPVARMTRNLVGEAIAMLVAYVPAILCFLLELEGRLAAISWLFVLLIALFFSYYYRKYQLLKKMQCPTCQVRTNLARQVATLKKYTGFYLVTGTLSIPVTYLLAWLIVRWHLPAAGAVVYEHFHPLAWWASPAFILILLVPLTVAMYYANAWYIHRLYGRHIKKLQDLLFEMESE